MHTYHLQDEFTDVTMEQNLIAAIAHEPALYFELCDILSADVFTNTEGVWQQLIQAIETDQPPTIPVDWHAAQDPHSTAHRLADLYQRRLLAAAQERLAQALFDETVPATTLATRLEEEALRAQMAIRETARGHLQWASDLLPEVLADATARYQQRQETGLPVVGLQTGITSLDTTLNGLNAGQLYLLGGAPGLGKTTLALQIATHIAPTAPVVFVTFENAPVSLALKGVCAKAHINAQQVQRGMIPPEVLQTAARAWQPIAERLAFLEGTSQLTVAQVRAKALHAMKQHQAAQCLIIVDYLQLWAKLGHEFRTAAMVRERVDMLGSALRELSLRLQSPILALSSQNRSQGNYGNGKGTAALDSLKESGDLEYAADSVLFLTEAKERQARLPARAVDLTIAKNRHGETGTIDLIFRQDLGLLREEVP
ncbi:MAG: DnaB-like helicase C-terminal domain-containing protein [Candidatus Tectomicrobia bacterium]